ncbi:MAG: NYN domain-containing protein [Phototrophicales bacterium]|nr:NYN domain-containing protein [Phototrophicales bacterium]
MAAYLIVDVDDLLGHFKARGSALDLQELAVGLRGGAALAAGLMNADRLKAVAVANWSAYLPQQRPNPQQVFKAAGYETFDIPHREALADALIIHYFTYDPDPVDELIIATTSPDLFPVIRRVKTIHNTRARLWGTVDVLQGTVYEREVIFQPLESLPGIKTKNVAVYIDFENISISLNEQGFVVNLDHLIDRFLTRARAYGQLVKMAAYAPWGQRGTLPPLVDANGREITEDAASRLALANIDPVFNLPGKNSADVRIARDVLSDAGHHDAADVYILASGDRDFNDVLNTLVKQSSSVVVWGVRGSTSRMLENNAALTVEYIEDFTDLQTHQSLSNASPTDDNFVAFTPSQWTSIIIQFDRLTVESDSESVSIRQLVEQLQVVGAAASRPRGEDFVSQALSLGILKAVSTRGQVMVNPNHPIVEKTRIIIDRIVRRVENTLQVRGWEYVNYGFLLKGLAMDTELDRPGCNMDDQWRSHWIDALVREQVLERQLIPHRQNPDDLVPVIKLCPTYPIPSFIIPNVTSEETDMVWLNQTIEELAKTQLETAEMVRRVVVSVEQFTSFRKFAWCPLGSLHRRLRVFDTGMAFQLSVEYLAKNGTVNVEEYTNPQSNYATKGISLNNDHPLVERIIGERDAFIKLLLQLYERNQLITEQSVQQADKRANWDLPLWFSIMETENVLNLLPGRTGQYSLFRTHHTVTVVAGGDGITPESPQ